VTSTDFRVRLGRRLPIVLGLLAGAVGIAILWASGRLDFPTIPPGLVILLAGAAFVAFAPWRWVPGVGAFLGLFIVVGLVACGGPPHLFGSEGGWVALGTWIQLPGVLVALVAGVLTTRDNYR
jgi:hypothetical protein